MAARIAHISDTHFGRDDSAVAAALLEDIGSVAPTLVVASGDLTQRARPSEFAVARRFVAGLRAPTIVVAGNHDVPLLHPWERFTDPYRRFRLGISGELQPRVLADDVAALGLNTARATERKGGRLNRGQVATLERTFASGPPAALNVLVTHHPFVTPPNRPEASIVGRADLALDAIERAGVHLVLSGHRHVHHAHILPVGPLPGAASVLVVLAGTACSRRHRGEASSYNLVEGDRSALAITVREWDGARFAPLAPRHYRRSGGVWVERPA
jgi:3',5'-cyclic AMP phosphodiesterase CpdA